MTEWALFIRSLLHDFGPPISHDTTGDLAPPKHTVTVDNYVNNFTPYVLRVGIDNELHQVRPSASSLPAYKLHCRQWWHAITHVRWKQPSTSHVHRSTSCLPRCRADHPRHQH